MFQKIIAFFMGIIAFFCQLFGIQNPTVNYVDFLNVSYGSSSLQSFDLSIPKNITEVPLVVFIHGGAWYSDDKDQYKYALHDCSDSLKIAAASINYRLISANGEIDYTDILDDITAAIKKIKEKAAEQGVTITKCALGGDSAGGHLSLLYAYKNANISPVKIAFVYSNSGPTNLADPAFYVGSDSMSEGDRYLIVSELSGVDITAENFYSPLSQAALLACSPITYVLQTSVPTLFAHGEKDDIVPISNARTLDSLLTLNGVTHDFYVYPNSGHGLENDADIGSQYSDKLISYVLTYLK